MAKSLYVCFLLLFVANCLASRDQGRQQQQQQFNECQLDRINALQPDNRIEHEAGRTEVWDHNQDQLRCAGVAVVKRTIDSNGLHLPSYANAPQLHYVIQGRGILGIIFPGCAETFEESEESQQGQRGERGQGRREQQEREERGRGRREQQQGQGQRFQEQQQDRHQKIRHIRQGDIIAIPAGVAYWSYNHENSPLVIVSLLDTSNNDNQLDQNPRRFYLAGNPEEEHQQQGQRQQGQSGKGRRGQQGQGNNIYSGFATEFLSDVFQVNEETIRQLQGENDDRRNIVKVQGGLSVIRPRESRQGEEEEEEREERSRERREEQERGHRRGGRGGNGLEETICTLRIKENLNDPQRADFYNPQAGRISTVNSFTLPILNNLQLSAERVVLYRNGIYAPYWNINAHGILYITRGRGRIQIVDHNGNQVFNDDVEEGQLLTVPQNFAVAQQAGNEGLEYINFRTNDNAIINPLVGRTSAIRAIPEDVLANAFQIPLQEARQLKYNRNEDILFSGSESRSQEGYIKL
ncbi:11S seed storage globulin [Quillaja saponaria]|uniref:11S seed storage globulin n=1 Tax=Quillaja saponaria TaxID=32244 RepID=A0AAD7Q0M3_QUISA|nr:11S seed storage globulin [Quillaja saponaria]